MTSLQKLVKIIAIAFAAILAFSIIAFVLAGIAYGIDCFDNNHEERKLSSFFGWEGKRIDIDETFDNEKLAGDPVEQITIACGAEIHIKKGEVLHVLAQNVPEDYRVSYSKGTLLVEDDNNNRIDFFSSNKAVVTVEVPSDIYLNKIRIQSGSGKVFLDDVEGKDLILDSGSGRIVANRVNVEQTDIDSGSGRVEFNDSNLGKLSCDSGSGRITMNRVSSYDVIMESGSGSVVYKGDMKGRCNIRSGSGSISFTLNGEKDNYRIRVDKGSGSFKVDGVSKKDGEFGNEIDGVLLVNSGSGSVKINFVK